MSVLQLSDWLSVLICIIVLVREVDGNELQEGMNYYVTSYRAILFVALYNCVYTFYWIAHIKSLN